MGEEIANLGFDYVNGTQQSLEPLRKLLSDYQDDFMPNLKIDWDDITETVPAVLTAIAMPLTFSIATGLGLGFIAYAVIKPLAGKASDVPVAVYVIAALFVVKFALI